jgi:hypothetical protein
VAEQAEQRTEQQITVREVTHIQASWAEKERGAPGAITLQLILDNGADEYVLRPTAEDLVAILWLWNQGGNLHFDLQRKLLMFGNIPANVPNVADLAHRLLGGR